jgi:homoserine dehydrogenase
MDNKTVKVGLIGFGTVGAGVAKILLEKADAIKAKTGLNIELTKVVDKDITTPRPVDLAPGTLTNDVNDIISDDNIDIGVELVGGTTFAKDLVANLLNSDKHVVTANKALLAEHGTELYRTAKQNGKCIAFEASCAGGIPIVSALRSGLAANTITAMYGIMNGTCNYILSEMTEKGADFADVLKVAQEKGYAEADPTLDINGGDTAHKLAILASLAFGCEIDFDDILIEGIENVSITDINFAKEMGYVLKLLAIAEQNEKGNISLRVHPSFISADNPIASVNGPFNAISVFGDAVGQTMYYGRGAGMMPTASAVVADIIEVAMGISPKLFNSQQMLPVEKTKDILTPSAQLEARFYIRLEVIDTPGTFALIAQTLSDNNISISGLLQHETSVQGALVPAIVTTHLSCQSKIDSAMQALENLDVVNTKPACIRIVDIPEDSVED